MRPETAERIAQLRERRRQKFLEEENRPKGGHHFEGRIFHGYLIAIEVFDQSPRDGTNTWLVWNIKLDRAELWRSCDLSRILRTNGKVKQNKCRYNSYWCLGPNGQSRWFLAMYHARQRLDGLKRGETADEFWKRADFGELTEEQMMDIYDKTPHQIYLHSKEDNDE